MPASEVCFLPKQSKTIEVILPAVEQASVMLYYIFQDYVKNGSASCGSEEVLTVLPKSINSKHSKFVKFTKLMQH